MQTAYHEAGHAVAAFLMKIRFTGLSIISDDDSFGRMAGSKWTSKFDPEHADKNILRSRIEARMIVLLAGYAAGMIFSGVKRRDGARKDFQDASWLGGETP
jgi:ATP-dependent Zn protease